MLELVRRLSKHTAIYGVGTIAQSLVQFVLLPLYARVFSQEEFGGFALLMSLLSVGEVVFRAGVQFAFLTLFFHQPTEDDRRRLARTAWTALLLQAAVTFAVLTLVARGSSSVMQAPGAPATSLRLIFLALFLSTPTVAQLAVFRSRDRSLAFIALNVAQLCTTLVTNVVLVAVLRLGVVGAFLGQAISAGLFGVACAVRLYRTFGFGFEARFAREIYRLGVSYAAANLLAQLLLYSNRWFLVAYGSLRDVALYDIGAKVGTILALLVVTPFSVAWASGCFAVAQSERPRETFANMCTYLLAALAWVGLGIGLMAREGVLLLAGQPYLDAWRVVPYVVTGNVLFGAYTFLTMGPALRKRSAENVIATLAALLANVLLNWLLIPGRGVEAAAIASLGSFAVLALVMYAGAQRCYPVDYQWGRLAKLAFAYSSTLVVGALATGEGLGSLVLRLGLVASFPAQLWALSIPAPGELAALKRLPAAWLFRGAA